MEAFCICPGLKSRIHSSPDSEPLMKTAGGRGVAERHGRWRERQAGEGAESRASARPRTSATGATQLERPRRWRSGARCVESLLRWTPAGLESSSIERLFFFSILSIVFFCNSETQSWEFLSAARQ